MPTTSAECDYKVRSVRNYIVRLPDFKKYFVAVAAVVLVVVVVVLGDKTRICRQHQLNNDKKVSVQKCSARISR